MQNVAEMMKRTDNSPIHRDLIGVKDLALSIAGTTGVGWGTAPLLGLRTGVILVHGLAAKLVLSSSDADIIATFSGDLAIGSTATADATITGTDADITALTAMGPAVAKVSPVVNLISLASANGVIYDNTSGNLQWHLNAIIDDASISGTADMLVNGSIILSYTVMD